MQMIKSLAIPDWARVAGAVLLLAGHVVWAYVPELPHSLRTALAIGALFVGTSYLNKWNREPRENQPKMLNALRGSAVFGFSLSAFNLYFVEHTEYNYLLAFGALFLIFGGLIAQHFSNALQR